MPKCLNVVFGFSSDKIQAGIEKQIGLRGFNVKGVKATTKNLIADYVKNHPEVDVLVLKEYLDGGGVYSPLELAKLVDEIRNINVVVVLSSKHRGTNDMRVLYSAGILNAFFSDGRFGANPDTIASLVCKGRTRKEARQYYRIDDPFPDIINLTYEEYTDNLRYLTDNAQGLNVIDRFTQISRMLTPGQMGAFIDKLPDKIIEILLKYSEFYDIAHDVYRKGYMAEDYKKPKSVHRGITKEAIQKKQSKEGSGAGQQKDSDIVAVSFENKAMVTEKNDIQMLGKDEIEESAREDKRSIPKRGLFNRGSKKQKEQDADDSIMSIFEETSDFELEGVGVENEFDDADMVERKNSDEEGAVRFVEDSDPNVDSQKADWSYSEDTVQNITPPVDGEAVSMQAEESSFEDLSIEELKALLGM